MSNTSPSLGSPHLWLGRPGEMPAAPVIDLDRQLRLIHNMMQQLEVKLEERHSEYLRLLPKVAEEVDAGVKPIAVETTMLGQMLEQMKRDSAAQAQEVMVMLGMLRQMRLQEGQMGRNALISVVSSTSARMHQELQTKLWPDLWHSFWLWVRRKRWPFAR